MSSENQRNPLLGNTQEVRLSSGSIIKIRELNGADEAALSRSYSQESHPMWNFAVFLSRIILENSYPWAKGNKNLTPEEVLKMPNRDGWKAMLASRILSYGPVLQWEQQGSCIHCGSEWGGIAFEENLQDLFDVYEDYPEYNQYYTFDEGELSFRWEPLSFGMDAQALEDQGIVSSYSMRNLSFKNNTSGMDFVRIEDYNVVNARTLRKLRREITAHDPDYVMVSNIQCPVCNKITSIPLISVNDFFYPG